MRSPLPRRRSLRTAAGLAVSAAALAGAFAACSATRDVTAPKGARPEEGRLAALVSPDTSLVFVGGQPYRLLRGTPTMPTASATTRRATRTAGALPMTVPPGQPYFEFQVEKPVVPAPGNSGPRYPELLKTAGVEGIVLAQFVVNADGAVDPGSLKILRSDHDEFTQAVRSALYAMHFQPALVGGRAVRQLVQQPFHFQLSK